MPHVSLAGADTVQGVWCCGGPSGGGQCVSLAAARPQTLWHAVQRVRLQGEGAVFG